MAKKLVKAVGNWVSGDRFWDREEELEYLTQLINEGANINVTGQRRMGKTSIIRELGDRLKNEYIFLQIDAEDFHTPEELITAICIESRNYVSAWANIKDSVSRFINATKDSIQNISVDKLSIDIREGMKINWQDKGNQIISELVKSETPIVMVIDEFSLLVYRILGMDGETINPENRKAGELFMSWIRYLTIKYNNKLRIIISGSIGLEPVLEKARLSATINSFTPFELKPWEEPIARGCINALSESYELVLSDEVISSMLNHLGCLIPHHIQMFFTYIHDDCRRHKKQTATLDDINRVYSEDMLGVRGHPELNTYSERLKIVLGTEEHIAFDLLTRIAADGGLSILDAKMIMMGNGNITEKRVSEIFNVLIHDGYIKIIDQRYMFVSKLLQDWWESKFIG